jgi:hypothetical protein
MVENPANADPPVPAKNSHRRRWFQFSLRSLMIFVALLAVPMGYVAHVAKIVRERKLLLDKVVSLGGGYSAIVSGRTWGKGPSLIDRVLGDEPIMVISFSRSTVGNRLTGLGAAFPEASILDQDDATWTKSRPEPVLRRGRFEIRY